MSIIYRIFPVIFLIPACTDSPFNNPYPEIDGNRNIYYSSFDERPKHLDPARAYSANEYAFLGQIYEPPLQYHFLKRPYQLVPLTAIDRPIVDYQDAQGHSLTEDAAPETIARVVYRITIQPGILYQPHPAFALGKMNEYVYHNLDRKDLAGIHKLSDFKQTGTRTLTAADYVYQIKRLVHPRINSPIAGLMQQYILGLDTLAKQLEEAYAQTPEREPLFIDLRQYDFTGASVIDSTTFEIVLRKKYPQFIYWLAMPFFAPMPWEAEAFYSQAGMPERNITLDWYPIGTGPFILSENNPNQRMVLDRNVNFRGEAYPSTGEPGDAELGLLNDAGKLMPFVDKAIYSLEKEAISSWNKFLQGYYDVSGISSDSFDQAVQFSVDGQPVLSQAMEKKNINLLTATTTSIFYTGFNMGDATVGGDSQRARLLRRAISIAVDFEEFITIFANGRGVAAQGPIPPGIFGHKTGPAGINPYIYDWGDGQAKRKSIATAQALMAQAGYPNGLDIETSKGLVLYLDTAMTGPGSKSHLDWLRKQFDKLGIKLVIRATDYNRFQEKMLKGTAQIYQWGWNADYPDPENFMFLLYGPHAKVDHHGENASNYRNPAFDELFEQMKSMRNSDKRQLLIDQMVEILRRDAPWLWGYHPLAFSLHHSWYQNAKPNLMANNQLKYKRIDPVQRKQARQQWNKVVWWPLAMGFILFGLSIIPALRFYRRREQSVAV